MDAPPKPDPRSLLSYRISEEDWVGIGACIRMWPLWFLYRQLVECCNCIIGWWQSTSSVIWLALSISGLLFTHRTYRSSHYPPTKPAYSLTLSDAHSCFLLFSLDEYHAGSDATRPTFSREVDGWSDETCKAVTPKWLTWSLTIQLSRKPMGS